MEESRIYHVKFRDDNGAILIAAHHNNFVYSNVYNWGDRAITNPIHARQDGFRWTEFEVKRRVLSLNGRVQGWPSEQLEVGSQVCLARIVKRFGNYIDKKMYSGLPTIAKIEVVESGRISHARLTYRQETANYKRQCALIDDNEMREAEKLRKNEQYLREPLDIMIGTLTQEFNALRKELKPPEWEEILKAYI